MNDLQTKFNNLKKYLIDLKSVVVAFSSGVDSTFLLKVATDILKDKVIAVTISSCLHPKREIEESINFCKENSIKQIIIDLKPLELKDFKENPINKCYICKKNLFLNIIKIAKENNIDNVIDGTNFDDINDYRPGLKALEELNIKSPLKDCKLTKQDIRNLSKELNLKTWNKSSFPCLATRFSIGDLITEKKISMIEKGENLLFNLGFKQFRVRIHNTIARIEVLPKDFEKILSFKEEIVKNFESYGFSFISLDLKGYITGNMNR